MCVPALVAALGAPAAAAAGGTAAAAGIGGTLSSIGALLSVGGALAQGVMGWQAAQAQAQAIAQQRETEAALNAVEDQRTRARMESEMRRQAAELAGRGINLASPTSLLLGRSAAQELSFASQAVRSTGYARQAELSAAQKQAKGMAVQSMLSGTVGAASSLLTKAPDLWPGLLK
jgi:hypothetical protein